MERSYIDGAPQHPEGHLRMGVDYIVLPSARKGIR